MVRDALDSDEYGVNYQLRNLPISAKDPRPQDVVKIIDPTQDDEATTDEAIENISSWPVIIVDVNTPAEFAGEVGTIYRDGVVVLEIVYITNDTDTARYVTDTLYTLRAIVRSLRVLMSNAKKDTDATRNDVHLRLMQTLTYGRVEEKLELGVVTGMVVATAQVRDEQPNF